jgi:trans-2,3-dihydro-3-hydroxyanthranilate isomerase
MNTYPIYLVDVFALKPYTGNPLAVVACPEPMPEISMQQIAAEMNFSETTFIATAADSDGGFPTRVFTPVREIAFTGHPILGTAWIARHKLLPAPSERVCLNLGLGQVVVDFEIDTDGAELCWFHAPEITLGTTIEAQQLAPALGLDEQDISTKSPIQVISAGTSAIIVPLRSREALERSRLDLQAFAPLASSGLPPLVYLYCHQPRAPANDIVARFFFEAREVREDPATGNGAAFLGAYLRQYNDTNSTQQHLRIEQGHELQRPSLIYLQFDAQQIRVGGMVVATLSGELEQPAGSD